VWVCSRKTRKQINSTTKLDVVVFVAVA